MEKAEALRAAAAEAEVALALVANEKAEALRDAEAQSEAALRFAAIEAEETKRLAVDALRHELAAFAPTQPPVLVRKLRSTFFLLAYFVLSLVASWAIAVALQRSGYGATLGFGCPQPPSPLPISSPLPPPPPPPPPPPLSHLQKLLRSLRKVLNPAAITAGRAHTALAAVWHDILHLLPHNALL